MPRGHQGQATEPTKSANEMHFLTAAQVEALAEAIVHRMAR
jgi:hypothetical protein